MGDIFDLVTALVSPRAQLKREQGVRSLIGRQVRRDVKDSHGLPPA
jgi:hypothetical protein